MKRLTLFILMGLAVAAASLLFIVPPIAQPQWYHDFADQRLLLGIPNFWNVISNLPFLIVGMWGIWYVMSSRSKSVVSDPTERWMHIFFFLTVALTGIGSAYYHLEPNNDRLVWDRLPLAMMFMALFHHRGAFESVCGYLAFFASRHPKRSNRVLLALV